MILNKTFMATNTSALKTFAQQTRIKLLQLIGTRLEFVLTQDTAELRGYEAQITKLKERIEVKGKDGVIEEVAYTWFNRVMALRFMDANGYNSPMVVTPAPGQMRPEILQDAMSGAVDEELNIKKEELLLPETALYRRLLVAKCNVLGETMPFLFEHISDYTELLLPENLLSDQSFVTDIRNGMTDDDCLNVEVMGWLYQFYITDRKADAEAKKSRKGGLKSDEQAAATQLFTPHWVVRYMVENSLGRIWMTLHPESRLKEDMPYYIPTPAGQTDSIPEGINSVSDITFIDPCMGSGHVLVYAFDLFCKMYEEEGYQTREIPYMVLTNNLFGIDIDSRCYQLAAFALTMKARAYHSRYLRKAVVPNVIALQNIDRDTIEAAGNWDKKSGMWQFENVDTIGSLLQIEAEEYDRIKVAGGLFGANLDLLKKQAEFLSRKYHCVVTNPPYLGKGFGIALRDYAAQKYSLTKYDTMVMFMEQCLNMSVPNGFSAMINFQSWMFVYNYTDFRKILIKNSQIHNMLHLGRGIFGADFGSVTFVLQKTIPYKSGNYYCLFDRMSSVRTVTQIESIYLSKKYVLFVTKQLGFLNIPGYNIGYWVSHNVLNSFKQGKSIGTIGTTRKGMYTGLNEKFVRNWKEVSYNNIAFEFDKEQSEINNQMWYPYANGGDFRKWFGNYDDVVLWKHNGKQLRTEKNEAGKLRAGCFNLEYIYKQGIVWSSVTIADTSMRLMCKGSLFSSASNAWFGNNTKYMLGFLNSKVSKSLLKAINPTVNANPGDIGQIPFLQDLCKGDNITKLSEDCVTISKLDWDAHETSWDFKENEIIRLQKEGLGEISVRLEDVKVLRYFSLYALVLEYKAFWEEKFYQLHANEEELNRQFIEIYGLQDELTPDVPLDEVTILQKGEISIEDNKLVWHDDIIVK